MSMSEAVSNRYGELNSDLYTDEELKQIDKRNNKRRQSMDYANLLFGQMMKNFISEEEYQTCVKLN